MPTYVRAKDPVDGWTRIVRKIMEYGMMRIDERDVETRLIPSY